MGETYLMLMYRNQRARFWHAQTKELWRSASVDKAKELLGQGTWIDMYDGSYAPNRLMVDFFPGIWKHTMDVPRVRFGRLFQVFRIKLILVSSFSKPCRLTLLIICH